MKSRTFWLISLLLVLALGLAACDPADNSVTLDEGVVDGDTAGDVTDEDVVDEDVATDIEEGAFTPSVTVQDQEIGEDNTVTVQSVEADQAGWIVIHADENGAPGPVIGQTLVSVGANDNIQVDIDPSMATETLYAMLHVDAGTAGEYEFPGADGPVTLDGNVVVQPFLLSGMDETGSAATPSVTVSDQELSDDDTVTVPSVTAAEAGWLVIHADDNGAPGPVLGQAAVDAGENTDVSVQIDRAAATETLFAMLHVDAGTLGEYEFPGADGPVTVDGNVVVQPFTLTAMMEETGAAAGMETIAMADNEFDPAEVSIPAGTTVVWENQGNNPHTTTADDGTWDSGTLNPGDTFEFTFDEPGEYPYHCTFHGDEGGIGMSGTITVTEG